MRYFLGLDGGGTKTAALILDASGAERGRGFGGPGNIAHNDDVTLARSVREAVREACEAAALDPQATRFAAVCAGVAGYSAEARRAPFLAILRAEVPVEETAENLESAYRLEPDYAIAYWGATEGEPGIVVIAGTGAVVYGRNAEGQTHREDGLGYLLGDRGSGFNLGLRALRYTLEQMREGKRDALTDAVLDFTGARSQNEIVHWLYSGFSPARVAALAPVVGALAEGGDPAARDQVAEMAHRLRHSVWLTRHKLWLPRETPIYPLGGLWQLGDFFLSEFTAPRWRGSKDTDRDKAGWLDARFNLAAPKHDAVFGAALLARSGSVCV
jgi:N-acetylglucosamine kinase